MNFIEKWFKKENKNSNYIVIYMWVKFDQDVNTHKCTDVGTWNWELHRLQVVLNVL